jgi:hypothetical protein
MELIQHPNKEVELWFKRLMLPFAGTALILQSKCWVCGASASEDHHLVPRSYGGMNGPQVSLCGNCHSCLHEISFNTGLYELPTIGSTLSATKLAVEGKSDLRNTNQLAKIWALSYVVFRSRMLSKSNPEGKSTKVALTMSWLRKSRLETLSKSLKMSQEETIHHAIDSLYEMLIGKIDN